MIDETLPDTSGFADPSTMEEAVQSGIQRGKPEESVARGKLIKQWEGRLKAAQKFFKNDFERMDSDVRFLSGKQWSGADSADPNYVANLVQRHIQQRVAALYAKNPKFVAKRRQTLDWEIWDQTEARLEILQQQIGQAMQMNLPIQPEWQAELQDIQQGSQKRVMLDKVAKTLEVIFQYELGCQYPPFKMNMKQLVRRTAATGIGWMKIGYARELGMRPEDAQKVTGITEQMAKLETLMADAQDDEIDDHKAEYAELEQMLMVVQSEPAGITHEGLVFDFPKPKSVIVDPLCTHLRTFTGARWAAEQYILSRDEVKEIYKIDIGSAGNDYASAMEEVVDTAADSSAKKNTSVCVWEVWDRNTGLVFTIADGYCGYLREPAAPLLKMRRFFPWFGLAFNELESLEDCDSGKKVSIYPISDVSLLKPMQIEYNRSREGLRRHRAASKPKYGIPAGQLNENDKDNLINASDLSPTTIEIQGLQPGQNIGQLIQPIPQAPIDPNLFDTSQQQQDILMVVGQSEASIGAAQSGVTATGDSIAEQSRTISLASQVDDLDDFLTEAAKAAGEILLAEMSPERAKQIAGPGAVWPDLSREEFSDKLALEVQAGSSGRPNKAQDSANFQKLAPILLQTPGINPEWFARRAIQVMDDTTDITDAFIAGMPSMLAQAQMKITQFQAQQANPEANSTPPSPSSGDPNTDPNQQGAEGANNSPSLPEEGGTQGGNAAAMLPTG